MPKHTIQEHFHADHFEFDGDIIKQAQKTRGGGRLTSPVITETTLVNTKYIVPMVLTDGTQYELFLDATNTGIKYTGASDKTLLFMASISAQSDKNATECEWQVYVDGVATNVTTQHYYDKLNKSSAFTIIGRVEVKQDEIITLYVSSDVSSAKITHNVVNIELFQI